jgi:multicomponent Na+:H+ antiporter subunit E
MEALKSRISAFVVLIAVWLMVMYPFTLADMLLGVAVALVMVLLPLPGLRIYQFLNPKRLVFAFMFLLKFLWAVVQSNLDVAFRVLKPRLPINPGIVEVKTSLKSKLGRLFLANAITLTPGTITVDVDGDAFFIHWIDVSAQDSEEATKKIVSSFEKYLEVIFG